MACSQTAMGASKTSFRFDRYDLGARFWILLPIFGSPQSDETSVFSSDLGAFSNTQRAHLANYARNRTVGSFCSHFWRSPSIHPLDRSVNVPLREGPIELDNLRSRFFIRTLSGAHACRLFQSLSAVRGASDRHSAGLARYPAPGSFWLPFGPLSRLPPRVASAAPKVHLSRAIPRFVGSRLRCKTIGRFSLGLRLDGNDLVPRCERQRVGSIRS
jgi:hypothetical protein